MGVAWSPLAAPALAGLAVSWLFAAFVLATRPGAVPNRRLTALLVVEGVVIFALNGGANLLDSESAVLALFAVGTIAVAAKPPIYLHFLATLETPLVRPLRTRAARIGLVAMGVGGAALWFIAPGAFLGDVAPGRYGGWETHPGFLLRPLALLLGVLYVVGLTLAASAYRHAPTEISRRRAKAYAIAFGARDAFFLLWAVAFALMPVAHAAWPVMYVSIALMPVVFVPVVVYGILRAQLFDIDLRIKSGVRRSIVASAFVLAFFAASETAENVFETALGPYVGLAAAAMLAVGLRPIERAAGRIADRAMPGVAPTADYLRDRKIHVYRAAVEAATQDGVITDRERDVLVRLCAELAITSEEAVRIETEVLSTLALPRTPARPRAAA